MCNLYTLRLSASEVRHLLDHYKLIGQDFAEALRGQNEPKNFYPKYEAPVVVERDGQRVIETLRWSMPGPVFPPKPGEKPKPRSFVTNVRNTASRHWAPWLASASVVVGNDNNKGGRCIVPASAFAEPDRNTSKPVIFRWFERADGLPFFFAGIWREWQGDIGTKTKPNVGLHRLFSFLTTGPNGVVAPIHDKAMPVLLVTAGDVDQWLDAPAEEALQLQKPAPDAAIVVVERKKVA